MVADVGESLTSSDLRNRTDILFREAWKAIEFGKLVGFEVKGDYEEVVRDMRYIVLSGKWKSTDVESDMINVYRPNVEAEQRSVWEELLTLKNQSSRS
ncbi:hypothetical protein V6N13_033112 [Hibiscus sabdariffa]